MIVTYKQITDSFSSTYVLESLLIEVLILQPERQEIASPVVVQAQKKRKRLRKCHNSRCNQQQKYRFTHFQAGLLTVQAGSYQWLLCILEEEIEVLVILLAFFIHFFQMYIFYFCRKLVPLALSRIQEINNQKYREGLKQGQSICASAWLCGETDSLSYTLIIIKIKLKMSTDTVCTSIKPPVLVQNLKSQSFHDSMTQHSKPMSKNNMKRLQM